MSISRKKKKFFLFFIWNCNVADILNNKLLLISLCHFIYDVVVVDIPFFVLYFIFIVVSLHRFILSCRTCNFVYAASCSFVQSFIRSCYCCYYYFTFRFSYFIFTVHWLRCCLHLVSMTGVVGLPDWLAE